MTLSLPAFNHNANIWFLHMKPQNILHSKWTIKKESCYQTTSQADIRVFFTVEVPRKRVHWFHLNFPRSLSLSNQRAETGNSTVITCRISNPEVNQAVIIRGRHSHKLLSKQWREKILFLVTKQTTECSRQMEMTSRWDVFHSFNQQSSELSTTISRHV